jgi:hypothetical protein
MVQYAICEIKEMVPVHIAQAVSTLANMVTSLSDGSRLIESWHDSALNGIHAE